MKNKSVLTILGFFLFTIGILSIFLSFVGLKLNFLGFISKLGAGPALLVHLIIAIVGVSMMYMARIDTSDSE